MRIGEAAAALGCHLETVRYHERIGLLPVPEHAGSGHRVYQPDDVRRMRFIAPDASSAFAWMKSASCCSSATISNSPASRPTRSPGITSPRFASVCLN